EIFPLAYFNDQHLSQFGLMWVVISSIPLISIGMPIMWWYRSRMALFPTRRLFNVGVLLFCVGFTTLMWVLLMCAEFATAHLAPGSPPSILTVMKVVSGFISKYVVILTMVPWALMAKLEYSSSSRHTWFGRFVRSPVLSEVAVLLLPALVVLTWLGLNTIGDARQLCRVAMFLPVVWLTFKYGWRASAFGSTLVIICINLTLASYPDPDTHQVQVFIAFAITCLFALGVRTSTHNQQAQRESHDANVSLQIAQHGLYLSELRMRQTSHALEQVGATLEHSHALAQQQLYRLADSVYPLAWRDGGLSSVLRETLARTLDEAGVIYRCEIQGRKLSQLAPGVQMALYRLACEAVVYICAQQPCTRMNLYLRSGETHGRRWAVLRLEGFAGHTKVNPLIHGAAEGKHLATALGASCLDIDAMRDHVQIYGGQLHACIASGGLRITALLHDAAGHAQVPAPVIARASQLCVA
ncbi:MAG: hypothetical protein WA777_12820, partial [Rhodanobacter sp.]